MENTFTKEPTWLTDFMGQYENGERLGVLCHGDLWAPQILWRNDVNIGGIIDWQTVHCGSPVEDILHILSTCTSVKNRRELLGPLLDYYHTKMTETLEAKGHKMPFTREYLNVNESEMYHL
uniref:CHK domain-containing protein n=1 Tax=Heterorhabditis bacteriophora TaxID=37862 RepID=A0A1I7XIA9_HETBA